MDLRPTIHALQHILLLNDSREGTTERFDGDRHRALIVQSPAGPDHLKLEVDHA